MSSSESSSSGVPLPCLKSEALPTMAEDATQDPPWEPFLKVILYYGAGTDIHTPFLIEHGMAKGTYKVHFIDPLTGPSIGGFWWEEGMQMTVASPLMEFHQMKAEDFVRPGKPCIIFLNGYGPPDECYRPGDRVLVSCTTAANREEFPDFVEVETICVNLGMHDPCECMCPHAHPMEPELPPSPVAWNGKHENGWNGKHAKGFKSMTPDIRAAKHRQRAIQCPNCGLKDAVGHFGWTANQCRGCKKMIDMKDWFVSIRA